MLTLMSENKSVLSNTCVVQQGDLCKYIYFVLNGRFTVVRSIDLIDTLNKAAQIILMCLSAGCQPEGLGQEELDELVEAFKLEP